MMGRIMIARTSPTKKIVLPPVMPLTLWKNGIQPRAVDIHSWMLDHFCATT